MFDAITKPPPTTVAIIWATNVSHAAVISGAGPSVLVLSTRTAVASVPVERDGWQVLDPGVPDHGAEATVLSPLELAPNTGDYLSAMRDNLERLRTALGCA